MPRPDRRRGGRVTPKGTRPRNRPRAYGPPLGPNYDVSAEMSASDWALSAADTLEDGPPTPHMLFESAAEMLALCDDIDVVEVWASCAQIGFAPIAPDLPPMMSVSSALASAKSYFDRSAAAMVVASISVYGPPGVRGRAQKLLKSLLRKLEADVDKLPNWFSSLGEAMPRRAVLFTDPWEEERTVWIDFERPDGEVRGLGVSVNGLQGFFACRFEYGPAIDEIEAELVEQAHMEVRPLELADARAMVELGLKRRDLVDFGGLEDLDQDGEFIDFGQDRGLQALVAQRVALLPDGGSCHVEPITEGEALDLCEEFADVSADVAYDDAGAVGEQVCRFALSWSDGDPLRWSPQRVAMFLCGWIPAHTACEAEWHDAVERVFPMWLRFAAQRRGIAEKPLVQNLSMARESFVDMRRLAADPANRTPATNIATEMLDDGLDLDDKAAVEAWIDRYNARPRSERR